MSNGQSIFIKGEITGSEDLTIAGRVEGRIELQGRVLTLAPGSQVTGDIVAGTVVVSGDVEGSIKASARLEVRATAVVDGEMSTPALLMVDGAKVTATVDMPERQRRGLAVAV
jgi:cytoskeletal protein CcmA (bactofilin family)